MRSLTYLSRLHSLLFVLLFGLLAISTTGCGGDDDDDAGCEAFPSLGGEITVDGESLDLTVAQRLVTNAFDDTYLFQLTGVSDDCNSTKSVNFTIMVATGASLTGTYDITDFFNAGTGSAYGSFSETTVTPLSQSLTDFSSGTLSVTDNGDRSYDFDLQADLVGGGSVSMSLSHQF